VLPALLAADAMGFRRAVLHRLARAYDPAVAAPARPGENETSARLPAPGHGARGRARARTADASRPAGRLQT
jgi:hypothetical protein